MKFYNGFVGGDFPNTNLNFFSTDDKSVFNRNLEKYSEDWYYKNVSITYSMNDYGHRCKSLKDINLDNYILFLGCSTTLGLGIELEKSFSFLISQEKKCDYYNLSLSGTGIDVVEHNLINWFFTINKKPKYVVLQYPQPNRFVATHPGYTSMVSYGTWTNIENVRKFIASADISGYTYFKTKIFSNLVKSIVDVPCITLNLAGFPKVDNSIIIKQYDLARDLIHGGIKTNEKVAELVLEQMKQ